MAGTSARYVVAIESGWLDAVRKSRLFVYELPAETFRPIDPGAGYFVSSESIVPVAVTPIDDVLEALLGRDVELRVMSTLWKLHGSAESTASHVVIGSHGRGSSAPQEPAVKKT